MTSVREYEDKMETDKRLQQCREQMMSVRKEEEKVQVHKKRQQKCENTGSEREVQSENERLCRNHFKIEALKRCCGLFQDDSFSSDDYLDV